MYLHSHMSDERLLARWAAQPGGVAHRVVPLLQACDVNMGGRAPTRAGPYQLARRGLVLLALVANAANLLLAVVARTGVVRIV
jgi:hypothetical protein